MDKRESNSVALSASDSTREIMLKLNIYGLVATFHGWIFGRGYNKLVGIPVKYAWMGYNVVSFSQIQKSLMSIESTISANSLEIAA